MTQSNIAFIIYVMVSTYVTTSLPHHCSDQTLNGQGSMHQCHPWIGNANTHSTRGFIIESQSHTYYIEMSQEITYYNNMA